MLAVIVTTPPAAVFRILLPGIIDALVLPASFTVQKIVLFVAFAGDIVPLRAKPIPA
jgi:hypothetical protein